MEQKFSVLMSVYAKDRPGWVRVTEKGYKTATLTSAIATVPSIDAYDKMVLAFPHFQIKRELVSTLRQMGRIGGFTYYRLVCAAFIKYLILPNGFGNSVLHERVGTNE